MSPKYSRGESSAQGSTQGDGWSEWSWNTTHNCYSRYRQNATGGWEYDYYQSQQQPPELNSTAFTPRQPDPVPSLSTLTGTTQQSLSSVDEITQGIEDTHLIDTNYSHQQAPPTQVSRGGARRYYGSTNSGDLAPFGTQSSVPQWQPRRIRTNDSSAEYDELDRSRSKRFKVHRSKEFSFGKVFKVLWSEPVGAGGTEITAKEANVQQGYSKIRRFVVVSSKKGHSLCLAILTYTGQGTLKYGVHPGDHAVVYTSKEQGPYVQPGEYGYPLKSPIRLELKDGHKIDPLSRLNYAKIYTVEHNVKVDFIGKVHRECEQSVVVDYNNTNRPLPNRPTLNDTPEETFVHTQGPDPSFQSQNYPNEENPEQGDEDELYDP